MKWSDVVKQAANKQQPEPEAVMEEAVEDLLEDADDAEADEPEAD